LGTISLTNDSEWLDSGSTFIISEVLWNGVDVKPTSILTYTVDKPMTNDITTRVYSPSITVVDLFGLPVEGADVRVTFANGTTVHEQSGSDVTVKLGLIPLGTFQVVISNLGVSSSFAGDASTQSQSQDKVPLSVPLLAAILAVIIAVLGALFYLRRRRASGRARPEVETKPKQKPIVEPKQKPIVEPKQKPIVEPKQKPIVEPKQKPIVEPKQKPIVELIVEPIEEPKQEPIVEPIEEPIVETKEEPTIEPTEESKQEPKEEPKEEPEPSSPPVAYPLMKRDDAGDEPALPQ
jgi:hypothetical protein